MAVQRSRTCEMTSMRKRGFPVSGESQNQPQKSLPYQFAKIANLFLIPHNFGLVLIIINVKACFM